MNKQTKKEHLPNFGGNSKVGWLMQVQSQLLHENLLCVNHDESNMIGIITPSGILFLIWQTDSHCRKKSIFFLRIHRCNCMQVG